jgi:two-component system response regulator HydG
MTHGGCVEREDLPDEFQRRAPWLPDPPAPRPAAGLEPLADVERRHILSVLAACGGNQAEAARVLGIARNTLWRKLEAHHRSQEIAAAPRLDGC